MLLKGLICLVYTSSDAWVATASQLGAAAGPLTSDQGQARIQQQPPLFVSAPVRRTSVAVAGPSAAAAARTYPPTSTPTAGADGDPGRASISTPASTCSGLFITDMLSIRWIGNYKYHFCTLIRM